MRYYSFNEFTTDPDKSYIVTLSEDEIREQFYPYWVKRMSDKFGAEYVKQNYTFEDCLTEWIVVHWAWESK